MATDVIIDPSTGQIYWNDSDVSAQSISIKGDAQNTIKVVGYSGAFSPGSTPGGSNTLATFTDNGGTDAFIPGTNGYDLGKDTARWRLWATSANFSGDINASSATQSTSLLTGAIKVEGGLAVSSNASIGQTLFFFNPSNALFTGFRAGAATASTVYTLPTNSPQSSVGTSVLSSTIAGVLSWVPLAASSASGGTVYNGTVAQLAFYGATGNTVGGASGVTYNPTSGLFYITHTTPSFGTTTGALVVTGGVGIGGSINVDGTVKINYVSGTALNVADRVSVSTSNNFEGLNVNSNYSFAFNVQDKSNNNRFTIDVSNNKTYLSGSSASHELRLYNANQSTYTGFAASNSGTVTYILPAGDGSSGQVLATNGSARLYWATITGGAGGGGTGVQAGGEFEIAYYTATGASVNGSSTFKNDTTAAKVSITHTTSSISSATGALTVSGGAGIGGSLWVTGIGSSISGVRLSHSIAYGSLVGNVTGNVSGNVTGNLSGNITGNVSGNVTGGVSGNVTGNVTGTVSGNVTGNVTGIATTASGVTQLLATTSSENFVTFSPFGTSLVGAGVSVATAFKFVPSSGVVIATGFSGNVTGTVSGNVTGGVSGNVTGNMTGNVSGNVTGNVTGNLSGLATTAWNIQVAIGSENLSHPLLFTRPTSTVSGSGGIAVSNDLTLFFNPSSEILSVSGLAVTSTVNSITTTSGALIVTGGASVGQSVSIGGRLQLFNSTFSTAFLSAQAGVNTTYTLPTTSPAATGTSVLSSTMAGVMSWVPLTSTVGGSGTPGGSNKQIQYNNASAFGGASGFEYTTGGIAITVGFFAPSGLGYTSGLWVNAINGSTTRIGIGLSNPQFELEILGELSATNKSFVINHPTKSGLKLRYGSLEGPENGVYVRGELKGTNIIEVPDHWVGLVHEDSYTVHLTPIGKHTQLYVEKIENYNVFVAENNNSYIHCYYSVWAERKDIPKLVTDY